MKWMTETFLFDGLRAVKERQRSGAAPQTPGFQRPKGQLPSIGSGLFCALGAVAGQLMLPDDAGAATAYHLVDDKTMYMGCVALGAGFLVLTFACSGRFLMSL